MDRQELLSKQFANEKLTAHIVALEEELELTRMALGAVAGAGGLPELLKAKTYAVKILELTGRKQEYVGKGRHLPTFV